VMAAVEESGAEVHAAVLPTMGPGSAEDVTARILRMIEAWTGKRPRP